MSFILANSLIFGSVLSAGLALIMWAGFRMAPDMWVGDYPPDIQSAYGEMGEKGKQARPTIGFLFFAFTVATVALSLVRLNALSQSPPAFLDYLLSVFITLMVFNLFDLLVIDWLIFVSIQPDRILLPGTEGMAGYQDYLFHFKAFLIGILYSLAGALLLSAGALGLQLLLG